MRQAHFFTILLAAIAFSCSNSTTNSGSNTGRSGSGSRTTGLSFDYNTDIGFDDPQYIDQETGPGLVFVQGGTFTMGNSGEDVMKRWDNAQREVTVASFYVDEAEVSNYDYREYLNSLSHFFKDDRSIYKQALPDTLVWRSELAYNEPYVRNYFRYPAYNEYPVVGVSWKQATDYSKWRTDMVNLGRLISSGYIDEADSAVIYTYFTTETYVTGQYFEALENTRQARGFSPSEEEYEIISWERGILLPEYRLLTEAEWEYAAYSLIGQSEGELVIERRVYPWGGSNIRDMENGTKGQMQANYVRGRGDMMGVAGALNDNADIPAPIYSYEPNDYGLYCMAGNVNEWVADVYRPLSSSDVEEFQPFRGNVITEYQFDENGKYILDKNGRPVKDTIADFRNYRDGDGISLAIDGGNKWDTDSTQTNRMYGEKYSPEGFDAFITDDVHVYKGGSWKDREYWLNPGTRRYLDANKSTNDIGFRCGMTRMGSPSGL